MKKIYTTILFIATVFLLFSVSANATVMRHVIFVPDYTSGYDLIGKPDVIYQNNLAFMESQAMEPEKIKLFLRPSRQILSDDEEIIGLAKSLTASLKDNYSKAKAIHDWVCTNVYYDNDNSVNQDVYDENGYLVDKQASDYVLANRRAKCEGYANLYCALLRAAGIPAQVYTVWPTVMVHGVPIPGQVRLSVSKNDGSSWIVRGIPRTAIAMENM